MKMTDYAKAFIGTKYTWGGNTAEQGFDCSGFVCEVLRAFGYIGREDLTAQGLYKKTKGISFKICEGDLVFWGKSTDKITHVAMSLGNGLIIEAGGEGSTKNDKGFVRVRPISHREPYVAYASL